MSRPAGSPAPLMAGCQPETVSRVEKSARGRGFSRLGIVTVMVQDL